MRVAETTVDNDVTLLFVVLKPVDNELAVVDVEVDSEAIELVADDRPLDVDVDNDVTLLFVVLKPVDNEL
ncbi:hypothetical protein, partial [Burkholderia territorii]